MTRSDAPLRDSPSRLEFRPDSGLRCSFKHFKNLCNQGACVICIRLNPRTTFRLSFPGQNLAETPAKTTMKLDNASRWGTLFAAVLGINLLVACGGGGGGGDGSSGPPNTPPQNIPAPDTIGGNTFTFFFGV